MRTLTQADRADAAGVARATESLGGIHPTMLPFVQWFSPKPALQRFIVERVKPQVSRTPFEVMAADRRSAIAANEGICAEGEYLIAWTAQEWDDKQDEDRMSADDSDWGEPDADTLEYGNERGELDSRTAGVKGRA